MRASTLRRLLIFTVLLAGALVAPAQSLAATTVSSAYGSAIYIDAGSSAPTMHGAYVAYTISTTTAQSDVWATIGNFGGGVVSLAPHAAGTVHVGPMAAGASTTVFFYVQAATATTSAQTHTVTVYGGEPGSGGTVLATGNESITVNDTQQASANKVDSTSVSTTAPTLGGTFTITVNGHTGTTATNPAFFLSPESDVNFPANAFQLVATNIAFNQSGCPSSTLNCNTFANTLLIPPSGLPSTADSPYVATYTFRAIATTTTTTSLSPTAYITSGNLVKHTAPSSFASLAPINPVSNTTTLAVTSSPTAVNATARTVTLTATATNTGSAINLDDYVATLPSGATYVPGSSTFNGSAIADPATRSQTLTWAGVFPAPASGSSRLSFQITLPAVDGAYSTSVIAHAGGNQVDTTTSTSDSAPASATVQVDATVPTASFTSTPAPVSSTSSPSFGFSATSPSTYTCSLDGGAWAACANPYALTGLADGAHTLAVTATDAVGNMSAPISYTWTVDTTPPALSIDSGPAATTNSTGATFAFTAEIPAAAQCRIDLGAWASCGSPVSFTGLAAGTHSFEVRDTDGAGNVASASYPWTIDLTQPVITFSDTPTDPSGSASGTIGFTASVAASTYTCSLDGAPAAPCSTPFAYTALANGSHSLTVAATSPAGNTGTGAFTWTIAPGAPAVTITSGPAALTNATTATVDFTADPGVVECSLDSGAWSACTDAASDTESGLADGPHTLQVRDTANGVTVVVQHAWTVDTVAPILNFTSTPPSRDNHPDGTLAFTSTKTGTTYACALDGAAAAPCTSPFAYTGLADGEHTLSVTGTDAAGNTATIEDTWTIDTAAPTISFGPAAGDPSDPSRLATGTIAFRSNETGTSFTCQLDGGTAAPCTDPYPYGSLADGAHTLTVLGTDAAGNSGQAQFTWTIDATAPVVTVTRPPATTTDTTATIPFSADELAATFECRLDGTAWAVCTSPQDLTGLGLGAHEFDVRATDAAGNVSSVASAAWTVVAPVTPPVVTPEPPVVTPEPPVVTPEPPVATPEPPVATPQPPVATPEPPVATPAAPSPAPVTSTGVGTAVQTQTLTIPSGGTVALVNAAGASVDSLTVTGQGTYVLDPGTGSVSFVPALGFTGTAAAVAYRVTDAFGRTATATYTPAVTKPAPPSAPSLTSSGPAGAAQSQSVTAPVGTTIALVGAGGTPVTRISVPGEGTYVVDTGAGTIRFVPDAGFIGRATPIHYLLRDAYGQATDATYAATVVPGATIARIAPVARVGTHVVLGVSDTVPVRCALSDTPVTGCSVVLQAVVGGRPVAVGHGAIRAVGHPGTVVVKVHLTAFGRTLTARLGGARFVAVATVRGAGGAYRARVGTHVVAATVPVTGPFLYRPDSTAMSTRTRAALVRLRARLAGARSVVCIGLAEGKPSDPDKDDWAPAIARARAACALLGHAHGAATHVQGRWTYLADDDGLPWIAGLRIVVRY